MPAIKPFRCLTCQKNFWDEESSGPNPQDRKPLNIKCCQPDTLYRLSVTHLLLPCEKSEEIVPGSKGNSWKFACEVGKTRFQERLQTHMTVEKSAVTCYDCLNNSEELTPTSDSQE